MNEQGDITAQWWRELAQPGNRRSKGAGRAALAQLRRARTPIEALMEPAVIDLARRLRRVDSNSIGRVGIVAAVVAHVRADDKVAVARACGPSSLDGSDDGKLKSGRFRRLLQARDDDLIDQMRRLVHLLGQRANVPDLAESILFWGDNVRKRWVLDYYRADRALANTAAETPASIQ